MQAVEAVMKYRQREQGSAVMCNVMVSGGDVDMHRISHAVR